MKKTKTTIKGKIKIIYNSKGINLLILLIY